MNSLKQKYIFCILILKECIMHTVGIHYPIEIIKLIIMMDYTPYIKINCGNNCMSLIRDTTTYVQELGTHNYRPPREFDLKNIIKISYGKAHTVALVESDYLTSMTKIYTWNNKNLADHVPRGISVRKFSRESRRDLDLRHI